MDLETTGLPVASDRIVEISFRKVYFEFLDTHRWTERLKPSIPISEPAWQAHGISDEEVVDTLVTFKVQLAQLQRYADLGSEGT